MNATTLRLRKLAFALARPRLWGALRLGVAPGVEHFAALRGLDCDFALDVGANRGQFALAFRHLHPATPLLAFEPIPEEADRFARVHGGDAGMALERCALGEAPGEAVLHLSRRRDSSSLLPIGRAQTEMFPGTEEAGTLRVPVRRLDDFLPALAGRGRALLKLDVQGFELAVLRGGSETLRRCAYVYVECSEIPLYEGQALRHEVEAFLSAHGFAKSRRFNETYAQDRLIQADHLFMRQ